MSLPFLGNGHTVVLSPLSLKAASKKEAAIQSEQAAIGSA
ncbi:hypothetical protein SS05631_c01500 [Sinorhizobium sp. CCBAU 05631]|nr:hypothetical protein SS05631_c01500 [Sinorhizobium sp. CCBAU 05631]